jgi:hypothetical protein
MNSDDPLRNHLLQLLDWQDAHVTFDAAIEGVPPEFRGLKPAGLLHSPWQLLEHLRLAQHDILEFCRNPAYVEGKWPDDYWPRNEAPPTAEDWHKSLTGFRDDLDELKRMTANPEIDLFAAIPHGKGQTYLRELLLVADHNAYHVGQLVLVRRCLGIWTSS